MLYHYFILMHVCEWLCRCTCCWERMCDLLFLDHIPRSITHFLTTTQGHIPLTTVHKNMSPPINFKTKTHPYAHIASLDTYAYGSKSTCSKWARILGACSLESRKCMCEILKHSENFELQGWHICVCVSKTPPCFPTIPCIQFKNQIHWKASLSMRNKPMKFCLNPMTFWKMWHICVCVNLKVQSF